MACRPMNQDILQVPNQAVELELYSAMTGWYTGNCILLQLKSSKREKLLLSVGAFDPRIFQR